MELNAEQLERMHQAVNLINDLAQEGLLQIAKIREDYAEPSPNVCYAVNAIYIAQNKLMLWLETK